MKRILFAMALLATMSISISSYADDGKTKKEVKKEAAAVKAEAKSCCQVKEGAKAEAKSCCQKADEKKECSQKAGEQKACCAKDKK